LLALVATAWPASRLGSEFMPDLNEGTLLYLPVTNPGLSITEAGEFPTLGLIPAGSPGSSGPAIVRQFIAKRLNP
jgi:hypothetical protein